MDSRIRATHRSEMSGRQTRTMVRQKPSNASQPHSNGGQTDSGAGLRRWTGPFRRIESLKKQDVGNLLGNMVRISQDCAMVSPFRRTGAGKEPRCIRSPTDNRAANRLTFLTPKANILAGATSQDRARIPQPLHHLMRIVIYTLVLGGMAGCLPHGQHFHEWHSPKAEALREKIAQIPDDADAHYWRGYAASHIKDLRTVKESYQKAIELNPDSQWYRISYGWALFNAGAFPEARDQWLSAYEFCEGNHRESQITVALGYYGVKDFERAASFYDKQVNSNSSYATFGQLQEETSHWTWREKEAVYQLFDIWRYSYRN